MRSVHLPCPMSSAETPPSSMCVLLLSPGPESSSYFHMLWHWPPPPLPRGTVSTKGSMLNLFPSPQPVSVT